MGWFSSLVGGVVGFFVGGPVGAVIGAGLGATKAGEKVVNAVLDFVTQPFLGALGQVDAPGEADRQQGVLIQREGSDQTIPVLYGYRKLGGIVTFAETGSTNNKYLYVAYVFCEGPVEGLREVYIDDWQLPSNLVGDLNANKLVTVNSDRYKDRVQLQFSQGVYLNDLGQNIVGNVVKNGIFAEAPSFRNDMNYNGLCVLFARFEWKEIKTQSDADNNPFTGNIPQLQIGVLGKRVASLLTDLTETQTYDAAPVRYSTNPAECLLDYLRNPRYGKGLLNADIDWDTWKKAARKCNQTVTYVASGIQGPILTLNYVVDTGQSLMSNVKTMLQNFRGYMPYVQGKYKLKIEDAGSETDILSGAAVIVATFNKDNIIGEITFNGIDKGSKYNVVSVTYVDPDQKFSNQTVVYPETEAERQVYITQDGGRENKHEVTYGGITNYAIAKDMARLIFNKSRYQDMCALTVTSQGLELEPGDNIRIQSNILNFGTVPWRIVSLKINENMTVSLGCVRNPDFIYPYVRVGEEDIVLPTYVPKGSVIYYPSSVNPLPLGLVPPTNAVSSTNTGTATTLPPTDPNGTGGGGVGGGTNGGPTVTDPTTPPTTPVDDSNNTPTNPAPPPPFEATLIFKKVVTQRLATGNLIWDIYFAQPSDGLYDYSILWWRYNKYSAWREVRIETKPGAGVEFSLNIGELANGVYDFYVRSFATDGRASSKLLQGQMRAVENQSGPPGVFLGVGTATVITAEGWSLPASEVPPEPRYDTEIQYMYIRPKLDGGLPLPSRKMLFGIQVYQDTNNIFVNDLVEGVAIYYRAYGETYWQYEKFTFGTTYINGQLVTGELAGNFGPRLYPSVDFDSGGGGASSIFQQYQFMARLIYKDSKPAENQLGPANAWVEWYSAGALAGNGYNFYAWGTKKSDYDFTGIPAFSSGNLKMQAITAAFNTTFQTVDQAPQGVADTALEIIPTPTQIYANPYSPKLRWWFQKIQSTKFRGFKIRYRPVIAGTSPAFSEVVTGAVASDVLDVIDFWFEASDFKYNSIYEFVVTAQVSVNGVIQDATNSIYSKVTILNEDPEYQNLLAKFDFDQRTTEEALKQLLATFPASAVTNAKSWNKIVYKAWDDLNISDIEYVGTAYPGYTYKAYLNTWYELTFQIPDSSRALIVYRRYWNKFYADSSPGTGKSLYYFLGPWERVRVPLAEMPKDAEGWRKISLRGPIDYRWYSQYYEVTSYTATDTLLSNGVQDGQQWDPNWPINYTITTNRLSGMRPYAGAGNNSIAAAARHEFLFVIEDSLGVEDNKGLYLRDFNTFNKGTSYKKIREGFGEGNLQPVTVNDLNATYNTPFTAGYGRRLSEALTSVDLDKLTDPVGLRYPAPYPGRGMYDPFIEFLRQPRDGTQVK